MQQHWYVSQKRNLCNTTVATFRRKIIVSLDMACFVREIRKVASVIGLEAYFLYSEHANSFEGSVQVC
jgi:hypothetical protein